MVKLFYIVSRNVFRNFGYDWAHVPATRIIWLRSNNAYLKGFKLKAEGSICSLESKLVSFTADFARNVPLTVPTSCALAGTNFKSRGVDLLVELEVRQFDRPFCQEGAIDGV